MQGIAEIEIGVWTIWLQSNNTTDQIYCDVIASGLMGNYCQTMHRIGVIRLLRENLPINLLGLLLLAGLVVLQSLLEKLLYREWGHGGGHFYTTIRALRRLTLGR